MPTKIELTLEQSQQGVSNDVLASLDDAQVDQGSQIKIDQGSQIKMIQVKEMMQDNDLKNSKSKDKGSRSRSQSMNEQSHYKQDMTKTRQSINVKSHIFNVRGDNDKSKQTPTRMSTVVQRSLKKETSTLGEIVSLNYIKSNKNVIGLIKSN
ncbi:hypothetical protein Tco_1336100 [Tanacetum coccineum]